jgi:hypothetical protein
MGTDESVTKGAQTVSPADEAIALIREDHVRRLREPNA